MMNTGARWINSHSVDSAIHEGWSFRIDVLCWNLTLGHGIASLSIFEPLVFCLQFLYDFETLQDNLVKAIHGYFLSWTWQRRWAKAKVTWAARASRLYQIRGQNVPAILFRTRTEFWKPLMWGKTFVAWAVTDTTLDVIPFSLSYLFKRALEALDFVQLYFFARILPSLILWMLSWHHPLFLLFWTLV